MSFERARRDDQKAERRENILATARSLCTAFGVQNWSLNELGRRADITKSNLYRYFGSREEVLLVLLHEETDWFATELGQRSSSSHMSISQFCAAMADIYTQSTLLCDLLCISASVLEHNIAPAKIRDIKLSSLDHGQKVGMIISQILPSVSVAQGTQIAFASGIIVAGLWPMADPEAPLRKVAQFEGLEMLALDFHSEFTRLLEAQIIGMLQMQSS